MEEQIIFTTIACIDKVYMEKGDTNIHILCNDFSGKNHVLVLHPAHVFKIHQMMMDAITSPQIEE